MAMNANQGPPAGGKPGDVETDEDEALEDEEASAEAIEDEEAGAAAIEDEAIEDES
jgi:hypothetical protein